MHSEPAIENRTPHGRRRKRGNGSPEGPVFVDTSGRRARLLRRIGLAVGAVCLGYAAVLGAAFLGWGTALTPARLLPFAGAGPGGGPGGPAGRGLPTAPAGTAAPTDPAGTGTPTDPAGTGTPADPAVTGAPAVPPGAAAGTGVPTPLPSASPSTSATAAASASAAAVAG
ncbi:hypothetical protein ACIGAN_28350 [Streptomyces sp. NPDC085931]|uniref:hypothetical protein n=1 Tax=Streptomyces sp. NPDC085931 TaxID=3365740 RepID=UPI0037CD2C54